MSFFDVNHAFFTVLRYPMSYLEFFGTILNILSVWLVARKNIWTWPVGNVAVILFAILFFQIQLYSDFIEQIYYLVTGFYGWWLWMRFRENSGGDAKTLVLSHCTPRENLMTVTVIGAGTLLMGCVMSRIHLWLPALFTQPAAFPYLDALTTVMSFAAQMLMAYKKIECWHLWITVDVIGVALYGARGVKFISLLYFIFLILATKGLFNWRKEVRELQHEI